jgi:hypothetical protein
MVDLLILYVIFCVATAVTAYVSLVRPVLERLIEEAPESEVAESPILSVLVFLILSILVAPTLFVPAIFPNYGENFKEALFETLK